jgi:hypothetical protein
VDVQSFIQESRTPVESAPSKETTRQFGGDVDRVGGQGAANI